MNASKTAVTTTDEKLARRVHALHGDGVPPMEIAEICDVPRDLVRDILSGRRLGPAVTGRAAPVKKRCPVCGQSLFSLPCLACELTRTPKESAKPVVIAIPRRQADDAFSLRYSKPVRSAVGRIPKPVALPDASMQRIERNLYCSQCGEARMETPSGCVCPNGHGRIFPRTKEIDRRAFFHTKRLLALPKAVRQGRRYHVEGQSGEFRRVKKNHDGAIAVNYGSEIRYMAAAE